MLQNSFLQRLKPIAIGSSMADMAMLLLVFFMTTTTSEPPRGVEVALPTAVSSSAEQDSLYLTIAGNGKLYLDSKPVTLDGLYDYLAMRQGEKDRSVSITADKHLAYESIAVVLEVLQEKDFLNVVFMSEPREGTGI